jgi:hypothetical protein
LKAGFVYCLVNKGLPGYSKVGRTIRATKLRADELSREYGTRHPFEVYSKHMVSDCVAVETAAHRLLRNCRVPKSELFHCKPEVAQKAVKKAARMVLDRRWYVRLWYWLILPRPERAPKRWRRARHFYQVKRWCVVLTVLLIVILVGLRPDIGGWLPGPLKRTAARGAYILQLANTRYRPVPPPNGDPKQAEQLPTPASLSILDPGGFFSVGKRAPLPGLQNWNR